MKRILLLLLFAGLALAQNTLDPNNTSTSASGSISVNGTDCTNSNACVWIVAPANGTSAAIQLSGTFTATLQFEKSVAGSSWVAATSTGNATSATSAGIYSFSLAGYHFLRVRASAYSAGPVVASISVVVAGGSGGGSSSASLPVTSNLLAGDGSGGAVDSTLVPANVISKDGSGNVAIGTTTLSPASGVLPPLTISSSAALYAGTYTSGITATGTAGQTCILGSLNGGGTAAAATVALTGTNAIAGGTALVVTAAGSGYTSPPTSSTASSGTATCSGTAVIATSTSINATAGLHINDTAGALTYVLPVAVPGAQICIRNNTARTGALTLKAPASTYIDFYGANGSVTGTLVSAGSLGDAVCLWAISATEYLSYGGSIAGWTNN